VGPVARRAFEARVERAVAPGGTGGDQLGRERWPTLDGVVRVDVDVGVLVGADERLLGLEVDQRAVDRRTGELGVERSVAARRPDRHEGVSWPALVDVTRAVRVIGVVLLLGLVPEAPEVGGRAHELCVERATAAGNA
jgi:hypothetical protein